jgi:hypothetical protein
MSDENYKDKVLDELSFLDQQWDYSQDKPQLTESTERALSCPRMIEENKERSPFSYPRLSEVKKEESPF